MQVCSSSLRLFSASLVLAGALLFIPTTSHAQYLGYSYGLGYGYGSGFGSYALGNLAFRFVAPVYGYALGYGLGPNAYGYHHFAGASSYGYALGYGNYLSNFSTPTEYVPTPVLAQGYAYPSTPRVSSATVSLTVPTQRPVTVISSTATTTTSSAPQGTFPPNTPAIPETPKAVRDTPAWQSWDPYTLKNPYFTY